MRLVNTTQVPARLLVTRGAAADERFGVLAAKATFTLEANPRLDVAGALPLFDADTPAADAALGVLPADLRPRRRAYFEVMLLGRAHAGAQPQAAVEVELGVGAQVRRMLAVGERRWRAGPGGAIAEAPTPFSSLPLAWTQAFGGRARVHVDREAVIDVADADNPDGRGFDPLPQARALAELLRAPPGFPIVEDAATLPGLLPPGVAPSQRSDRVPAICWAPVPSHAAIARRAPSTAVHDTTHDDPLHTAMDRAALRAHPDWILPLPAAPPRLRLRGTFADGEARTWQLPALRVSADGNVGGQRCALALRPETLVLLPEQQRFYLVYRACFRVDARHGASAALRLRVDEGWSGATEAS